MTQRKEGWYHIRMPSAAWECVYWNGATWESYDYVDLLDGDIDAIGPRIPSPDEPWQLVPMEPTKAMP